MNCCLTHGKGTETEMSDFDKLREFFTSWPCIVIGFCLGGWPGFLLLLWKIADESSGNRRRRRRASSHSIFGRDSTEGMYWDRDAERWVKRGDDSFDQQTLDYDDPAASYRYTYQDGKAMRVTEENVPEKQKKKKKKADTGTRKTGTKRGGRKSAQLPKIPDGKGFTIAGGFLTVLFGANTLLTVADALYWYGGLYYELDIILPLLMFTAVGAGLLAWGRFKKKKASDFRKLLQLVGSSDRVSLRALSEASGLSYRKTCDQLQEMIDAGYLGERAYINLASGELVLDGTPVRAEKQEQAEPEIPAAEETDAGDEARDQEILRKIRAADEAIPDEEMSRKIRRVEEITGHILDYQKKHPDRAPDLRKFLNYYLPTTLKLLHTYAELDRQKISGENINATKRRIEGMMDKVVEGFELQLDKLYENEMLDISSDISVMETMLSQDGLAPSSEMQIPKAPDAAVAAREAAAKEAARQNAARQAATAANAGFTTPEGIHLTLDPEQDDAAGGAAAQAAPRKD